jgi:hypothetical protein
MTALVYGSKACSLGNQKLLANSRSLIARNLRLLNPTWEISGGADGH